MKIEWSEYLKKNSASDWVIKNDEYKAAWEEVLKKIQVENRTTQNRFVKKLNTLKKEIRRTKNECKLCTKKVR